MSFPGNMPMRKVDLYWALQLGKNASLQEIEEAYNRLYPKYRDLVNEGHSHYTELMNLTQKGYEVLSDPEKRKAYDVEFDAMEKEYQMAKVKHLSDILAETRNDFNRIDSYEDHSEPIPAENKPAKKLTIVQQLLILVGANLLVFWLNYNASPPGIVLGIGGFVLVIFFIYVSAAIKVNRKEEILKAAILLVTMLTVNFCTYAFFQNQELYVDNQTGYDIYFMIDGKRDLEVKGFKYEITEIRPGKHELKAFKKEGDSLIEKFEVDVETRDRRLYNVLSKGEYIAGKKSYSENAALDFINGKSGTSYPEEEIKDRWIPLNYSFIFENPPSTITIKKKITDMSDAKATRSYFIRKNQPSF